MAQVTYPSYDALPRLEGTSQGCAWGIFDKDNQKDVFGCLNKVTSETVKEASKEIRDGVSISLNWPIGALKTPSANRNGLKHKVISFMETSVKFHGYDDEVQFNTQCSSQWDCLCHYYHQDSQRAYNGTNPSAQDLTQEWGSEDKTNAFPTLNHWHQRGGLVTRGVLLDFAAYASAKNITNFNPVSAYCITIQQLEDVAAFQNVTLKQGDICIIRTGFTEVLGSASAEEQARLLGINQSAGIDPTEESARWFWDKGFSAVASDNIAFETKLGYGRTLILHQYFLSLFGLHIGELWDLKKLSDYCAQTKKYSFFFTSSPLNVPGAVGSPPNALAIF